MRWLWLATGLLFLVIGVVGVFLPVLPTTPFLLIAAAAFARSSPRLHAWLLAHPLLGPPIRDWQEHGAISKAAKRLAIGTMAVVFLASLWLGLPTAVLIAQAGFMAIGAAFVLSRPSGPSK